MVQNPNAMAVESAAIADQAGVSPPLVRFAKHMGYNGFSEMKRVFQSHLISTAASKSAWNHLVMKSHQPPAIHQQLF